VPDNAKLPNRRSIRLAGHDYSEAGAYFVTVCVQDRKRLFGEIVDAEMRPNAAGEMIRTWWTKLPEKFPEVAIDAHVVMPNHFHGIVIMQSHADGRPHGAAPTLGTAIDWFETMTTNAYIRGVRERGWRRFERRLWQRNYYEHIVRTEEEFGATSEHIDRNPASWASDRENPAAGGIPKLTAA
jgi:REP element-mobilizing transposase RayT